MVSEAGGRWDVGIKDNAVYLERRTEDNERLFEAQLEPEEARELARLLKKYADKSDSTGEDASRDEDSSDNEDSDDDDDSTDKSSG